MLFFQNSGSVFCEWAKLSFSRRRNGEEGRGVGGAHWLTDKLPALPSLRFLPLPISLSLLSHNNTATERTIRSEGKHEQASGKHKERLTEGRKHKGKAEAALTRLWINPFSSFINHVCFYCWILLLYASSIIPLLSGGRDTHTLSLTHTNTFFFHYQRRGLLLSEHCFHG